MKKWMPGTEVLKSLCFVFALCVMTVGAKSYIQQTKLASFGHWKGKNPGYLAIVIDDFGYCGDGTKEMLSLSIPFTAAVMPFSECTKQDVENVQKAGKEMMIHMPMESLTGKKSWVGDKGVFKTMTEEEIKERVLEAMEGGAICHGVK